jgi:hypothetical protein
VPPPVIGRVDFFLTGCSVWDGCIYAHFPHHAVREQGCLFRGMQELSDLGPTADDFRDFVLSEFSHSHSFVGIV